MRLNETVYSGIVIVMNSLVHYLKPILVKPSRHLGRLYYEEHRGIIL